MFPISQQLPFIRSAMNVKRYHQYHTAETDNVGKHSCGVALLAHLIDPDLSKNLLMACLTHDLGEWVMGDIPAPAKRLLSEESRLEIDAVEDDTLHDYGYLGYHNSLRVEEQRLLKLCDYFDGFMFCVEELNRGNRTLFPVAEKFVSYLSGYLDESRSYSWYPRALSVYSHITKEFNNVR